MSSGKRKEQSPLHHSAAEPAPSRLSFSRTVTYQSLLHEHLLENTLLLDTLSLEAFTKAISTASKSLKDVPKLSSCVSVVLVVSEQGPQSVDWEIHAAPR